MAYTYSDFKDALASIGPVYTDANAYAGKLDPAIYQNCEKGFALFHAGIYCLWKINGLKGGCSLYARNIFDTEYMAFTEPGPGWEIFGRLKIMF